MSREFARSSLVSIWAGSARNDTTAKATPRGSRASRTTCASRDLRRVPAARALRIEGSYTTARYSVRSGGKRRRSWSRGVLSGTSPRRMVDLLDQIRELLARRAVDRGLELKAVL